MPAITDDTSKKELFHAVSPKGHADFNDHPELPAELWGAAERFYDLAFVYENEGLGTRTKKYFEMVISLGNVITQRLPASATTTEAHYILGICYERLGEYAKAVEYYQRVIDNWPGYKYAWEAKFKIERRVTELQRWDPALQ